MPYWPWNKKKMLTSSNIEEDTGKSQGRPKVCPFVWWGFSHLEITATRPGSNTATGLLLRYIRASCAQKIIVFFLLRICSKTSIAVGASFFICGLLVFALSSCQLFRLLFEQLKNRLKLSSVWELQTHKWLQKRCLHLDQQRSRMWWFTHFSLFSSSSSLFGHILGEAETELPLCVPIRPSNRLWNRVLRYTKTHIQQAEFNCVFIATAPTNIYRYRYR